MQNFNETSVIESNASIANGAPNVTVHIGSVTKSLEARVLEASSEYKEITKGRDMEEKEAANEALKQKVIADAISQDEAVAKAEAERLARVQGGNISQYVSPAKVETSWEVDDSNIPVRARNEYVWLFKAHQRRTAVAAMEMCRVVYEASKTLSEHEYDEFCKNIGYKSDSSTVRKFLAIGKVYPRMIKYADQLPAACSGFSKNGSS